MKKILLIIALLLIDGCSCNNVRRIEDAPYKQIESINTCFPFVRDPVLRDSLDLFLNQTNCYKYYANVIILSIYFHKSDLYASVIRSATVPESDKLSEGVGAIELDNENIIVYYDKMPLIDTYLLNNRLALKLIEESTNNPYRESMEAFFIGRLYKSNPPDGWILERKWQVTPGCLDGAL